MTSIGSGRGSAGFLRILDKGKLGTSLFRVT